MKKYLLIILLCFLSCKSSKISKKGGFLNLNRIDNYLPDPVIDSIPVSNKTFNFNIRALKHRNYPDGEVYFFSALPNKKMKKIIAFKIDSIIDNNNNLLSRKFHDSYAAHDVYTYNIRGLITPMPNTKFIKKIRGSFYECNPSEETNTKLTIKDFTKNESYYKNLLGTNSQYDNKIILVNKKILSKIRSKDEQTINKLYLNKVLKSKEEDEVNTFIAKIEYALNSLDGTNKGLKVIDRINSGETGLFFENKKYEILHPIIEDSSGVIIDKLLGTVRPEYRIRFFKYDFNEYKSANLVIELANKRSLTLNNFEINSLR